MNRAPCLCPGYTHVESFAADDEYEEEEEEVFYVTLDCENVEPSLVPSSQTYRLIGLDTPTPFLQLSGTILKGAHDALVGTELIFAEDNKESAAPTTDRTKKPISYLASSEQRICFKEVRVTRKGDNHAFDPSSAEPEMVLALADDRHALDRTTGNAAVPPRKKRRTKKEMAKEKDGDDDDYSEEAPPPPPPRRTRRSKKQMEEKAAAAEGGGGEPAPKKKRGRPKKVVVEAEAEAGPQLEAEAGVEVAAGPQPAPELEVAAGPQPEPEPAEGEVDALASDDVPTTE